MKILSENLKYIKKLRKLYLLGKIQFNIENLIDDEGISDIAMNLKYIPLLECLPIGSNQNLYFKQIK